MCGIFGYLGNDNDVVEHLVTGLKRLEYRGYDSAGIAVLNKKNKVSIIKDKGKVSHLEEKLAKKTKVISHIGIAHTRWATHGEPNKINSQPHNSGKFALVHNGIIENYQDIKYRLTKKKVSFNSNTDSEVIVKLIDYYYKDNVIIAIKKALKQIVGAYGIALICEDEPHKIFVARRGSPLIIGMGGKRTILASDASAIIGYTKQVIYLEDGDIAELNIARTPKIITLDNTLKEGKVRELDINIEMIEKKGFPHFMLKEIHEQVETIKNTYRGRIDKKNGLVHLAGLNLNDKEIARVQRIILLACGTSWHAAMIGEYLLENLANISVEVDYASEFTHRNCMIDSDAIVFVISQSGETADTLAALKEAKQKGAKCYGIVNVVGSTIARETKSGIYIHAGPEIGVASTKAFTSQVTAFVLLSIFFGRKKNMLKSQAINILQELEKIPLHIQEILNEKKKIKMIAKKYLSQSDHALYLGRSYNFPVALEGALKLKEISYIHAEGYPAAEMKHGPIALIDKKMPVIVIANNSEIYQKTISNIIEIQSRKGIVIAIASRGNNSIKTICDHVIFIPKTNEALSPLLSIIPLQLMSYYTAVERGCNIDQPRNLAKSITVE